MSKQIKWLLIILLSIFLVLQYRLWFASGGILDMFSVKSRVKVQAKEVDQLSQRNDELITKVKSLKEGDEDVAKHARNDLGLVDHGEEYIQLVDQTKSGED